MAIEVQRNKYWFRPLKNTPSFALPFDTIKRVQPRIIPQEQQTFLHNYLHDVEGLFWVAAWVLFYTHPVSRPLDASDLPRAKQQLRVADRIFPSTLDGSVDRVAFMMDAGDFSSKTSFLPEEYASLRAVLSHVQCNLCEVYTSMEDPLENVLDKKLYGRVYDVLSPLFLLAKECAQGEVMFLSDAIQKVGEKAKEEAVREKVVVPENVQDANKGRDALPAMTEANTPSKRTRERQPEDSAAAKKRKILNAESPSKVSKQTSLQGT